MRRYNHDYDKEEIDSWATKRKMNPIRPEYLPDFGLIVPGLAVGFLYMTDSQLCAIHNIVANPDSEPEDRSEAIDQIVGGLIEYAKQQGFTAVLGTTDVPVIVDRALAHGFIHSDRQFQMIIKYINNPLH